MTTIKTIQLTWRTQPDQKLTREVKKTALVPDPKDPSKQVEKETVEHEPYLKPQPDKLMAVVRFADGTADSVDVAVKLGSAKFAELQKLMEAIAK